MKTPFAAILVAALFQSAGASSPGLTLTADHSAARWDHAYPVGNGSMGGMSLGDFPNNTIVLNHDAIWTRPKQVELPPGCRTKGMDDAFQLALKGDYAAAQKIYCQVKDKGNKKASFQGLGALQISHLGIAGKATAIRRSLDLMTGESGFTATLEDGTVSETLLASYPDHCLVLRLESTRADGLHCRFTMNRQAAVTSRFAKGNELGYYGDSGTKFAVRARILPDPGGTVAAEGDALVLKGGKAATVIIAAATDYHRAAPRKPRTDGWAAEAEAVLKQATARGWPDLSERAIADHRRLMGRCLLGIGKTDPKVAALSTPERVALLKKGGEDPELIVAFFQLGRHLLVSSSRPGSLPPNLQGLWEPGLNAAWSGDFHLNVNVQMNLWPANVTGLGECNEPFFALMKLLQTNGKETAASLDCRGYAAGLASDAWGYADWCGGSPEWDSYVLGGHWAQEHLMEYYRFTQDMEFLKDTAWPILQDGSLFMLDWLRPEPGTDRLIAGPGSSPENAFSYQNAAGKTQRANISIANTHDHAIAWETFSDTLECAALLGIDNDLTKQVAAALKRVPPPEIGADGRIMEWWKPFGEVWKGHRHKSHLHGLFPGHQITLQHTPELAKAAEKSLIVRMDPKNGDCAGGGHTGWNLAWSTSLWARLQRGDLALDTILEQMRTQMNENLFNRCGRPFQIDGNLGTPAAIAEMLLQSHAGEIHLLPALPAAWPSGKVTGLRARGGVVVDIEWRDGKVIHHRLSAPAPRPVKVRVNGELREETPVKEG